MREVVALDPRGNLRARPLKSRQDPAILDGGRLNGRAGLGADAEENEPRRIPELVGQLLALGDPVLAEVDVGARRHHRQPPAHGVGSVSRKLSATWEGRRARSTLDQIERIDPGTQGLRHPAAVRRLDRRVYVDVVERNLVRELQPHHDHPRYPQEDDVPGRDEHVSGVEGPELGGGVGPAERGERP